MSQLSKKIFAGALRKARGASVIAARARAVRVRRSGLRAQNIATMGLLGIERKFYDTALTSTALTAPTDATGGEFDPSATSMISTPAVGDDATNRDGKKINILSVQINGLVHNTAAEDVVTPIGNTRVFVALVLDTQSNAAQMNSEDCFKNTGASATLATSPIRNLLFANRFRVLKEQVFDLTPITLAQYAINAMSYNARSAKFNWFLKFPGGLPVNFNAGTTASIANVIDNSLHIIAYTNNTVTTPQIAYNARIRFVG